MIVAGVEIWCYPPNGMGVSLKKRRGSFEKGEEAYMD